MTKQITIYTRTNCPYCVLVMKFLDMKNIPYTKINMEEDDASMNKVMSLTGRTIAPTTLVDSKNGDQKVIVGYDLGKIIGAIN